MYDLKGRVAVVTGAAHKAGMGHAIAIRLARDGADVAVVDVLGPDQLRDGERAEGWQGLDSVVKEIEGLGRRGLGVVTDITSSDQVNEMARKVLKNFGHIDILVNNAGILGATTPIVEFDEKLWEKTMTVNLTGAFLCCKAIGKIMIDQGRGGKIVNTSSIVGKVPWADRGAYSASKAGVISLTYTLALELAPHKINVNSICPGTFETGIIDQMLSGKARSQGVSLQELKARYTKEQIARCPLGRIGRVEDIANAVAFFASSDSDFITGQTLNVDGGILMGR